MPGLRRRNPQARQAATPTSVSPLLQFIGEISPEFAATPPVHLMDLVRLFERARDGESVRALISYPIRHWKTETVLHGLLWLLVQDPTLRIILMTYSNDRAQWLGKRLRDLARRTTVGPVYGKDTLVHWENAQGGGVLIMSADQSREGYDAHVILCDDPIDEKNAVLKLKRDAVDETIAYYTLRCKRAFNQNGPVIICASRFDVDDPIGRRQSRKAEQWESFHSPAIINLGGVGPDGQPAPERAFAPTIWSLESLKKEREVLKERDPYERIFWARLQGQPRQDEGSFRIAKRYPQDTLPKYPGFIDAMGFDLSFTTNKRSDWSSVVVGRLYENTIYVREFKRFRAELPDALLAIQTLWGLYGQVPVFSYMSGPEVAVARYFASQRINIHYMPAKDPKWIRGRKTIDAHNAGRILYPAEANLEGTFQRMASFHGVEEDEDDEVDALVSLYEGLVGRGLGLHATRALGSWRYT